MPETALIISENLASIREMIPDGITLVAVSKFQPVNAIKSAYEAGQIIFGESRVQELLEKIPLLPGDIKWHFIGHLQTNKVRQLIGKTSLIESVDSIRLLEKINEESISKNVITRVLLQLHVAREETKFGFSPDELIQFVKSGAYKDMRAVSLCGLMAMGTNTNDIDIVRNDFQTVANVFKDLKNILCKDHPFEILSMGMSGDWPIAVEEGSNEVRIGSAIFGNR